MSISTGTSATGDDLIFSDAKPIVRPSQKFILRPLCLSDVSILALQSAEAYWGSPVNQFIAPHAAKYRADFVRNFRQGIQQRLFNPRGLSIVACDASNPATPVGYGQLCRLGSDDGAKRYISQRTISEKVWMFIMSWFFWAYHRAVNSVWPDRSIDKEAMMRFNASMAADNKHYWVSHPERGNRWYVQSLVISRSWQGKGIGRLILSEGIKRAQQERALMGLAASPAGEHLYRKMGFEMLGDFSMRIGEEDGGGVMIRYPEGHDGCIA